MTGQASAERPVAAKAALARFAPFVAFLLIGVGCAFHPSLFSAFRKMQENPGDTRLNNFILEDTWRWVTLRQGSLWDQPIFFPVKNVGAYTDILLGAAPLYWIFRVLRFAPDTSFQLWMIAVLALDFVVMAAFLRNCLELRPFASALGAFLFAFASPRVAQIGHQQLLPQFFMVGALYGIYRSFQPRRMGPRQGLLLFFVCAAAQLWAGFYLGWFLLFGTLVCLLCVPSLHAAREALGDLVDAHWRTILVGAAVFALLVAPMASHYLAALHSVGARKSEDVVGMIPPLWSWTFLGKGSWLYSWQERFPLFHDIPYPHEQRLGIGWITLGCALVGLYRLQKNRARWGVVWLATFCILLVVTSYPGEFTAWPYLALGIPGAEAIRAVSRTVLLLLLPLSIGLAWFAQSTSRWRAALLVAVVCVLEQGRTTASYDKLGERRDVSALAARIGSGCEAFYYSPALPETSRQTIPVYQVQIDAMWAALETGVPTVNGYSGNLPPGFWWELYEDRIFNPQDSSRIAGALRRWDDDHGLDPANVCWITDGAR